MNRVAKGKATARTFRVSGSARPSSGERRTA